MAKKVWTPAMRRAFAEKMKRARAAKHGRKTASRKRAKRARKSNPPRKGGVVILVKGHGKTYYYTRDRILVAREAAAKHFGRLTAGVKRLAHRLAREVPTGYRVAIHSL